MIRQIVMWLIALAAIAFAFLAMRASHQGDFKRSAQRLQIATAFSIATVISALVL